MSTATPPREGEQLLRDAFEAGADTSASYEQHSGERCWSAVLDDEFRNFMKSVPTPAPPTAAGEPLDPDLIEAKEMAEEALGHQCKWTDTTVSLALAAIRRGRELGPPTAAEAQVRKLREALVLTPTTKKWLADNLLAAKRLMKVSSHQGNGRANFAAHDAHNALKEIEIALSPKEPS